MNWYTRKALGFTITLLCALTLGAATVQFFKHLIPVSRFVYSSAMNLLSFANNPSLHSACAYSTLSVIFIVIIIWLPHKIFGDN